MRKRQSIRGLLLATINVLVILGVTYAVKSLAAGDASPSQKSLSLPAEAEFALPSPGARAAFASAASSTRSGAAAAGQDTSAQVVPPSATGWEEAPPIASRFDDLSYEPARPFAPLVDDSGSWPQLQASASGYGSSIAPSYTRRSGAGGGFSGMGGGFPSAGGGGGGRNSQSSNSQSDPASAALHSSSGGASAAGSPLLPPQAQGNPQGNSLLGGNGFGGPPSFVLNLASNLGSGGLIASGLVVPTGAGGSAASLTQVQTPVSVPEPSTVVLLGCGLALAAYRNRRRLPLS